MRLDTYLKFVAEFPDDIYLADKDEPICPIIMAKDIDLMKRMKLPFASYFGISPDVDPESREDIYLIGAKLMRTIKQVIQHCERIVDKDELTSREDAINRMAEFIGPAKAEELVAGLIEEFQSSGGIRAFSCNIKSAIDSDSATISILF